MDSYQELIFKLKKYWSDRDCIIQEPYDLEVGAGTMCPETFLRVLGPKPYRVAYVQPSRRPADGRYGENPNRLYKHMQLQVVLKPSPNDVIDQYLGSLGAIGIDLRKHDIKFEEDNWESPTLGAWGIGWQGMLDGLEITAKTAGNAIVEDAIMSTRTSIEHGETIAAPLKETAVFPAMVLFVMLVAPRLIQAITTKRRSGQKVER